MTRSGIRNISRRAELALCAALALALPARAQVVAERGPDQITVPQARALIASLDPDTRAKLLAAPEGIQTLLRDTLLQKAILEAASAQHWEQRPEVAEAAQRAHDNAVAQSFLAAQAQVPANYPSEAELQAAYERAKPQLLQPRAYRIEQLFLVAAGPAQETARRQLASVRLQMLRTRTAFAAATRFASGVQYADLGWVPENRLQPAVKAVVSGLPEGQVGGPVCTPAGCALVKLAATRPAGPAPLDQVRAGLIRLMRAQKQHDLEQAYAANLIRQEPVRVDEIELAHVTKP